MSDLIALARKAGLAPVWTDAFGKKQTVSPDTLRAVLTALGYRAETPARVADSMHEVDGTSLSTADRAYAIDDFTRDKLWAAAVQVYALRGKTAVDFGDFAALGQFAEDAAGHGADAVAISPVHALFGARPSHIGPYSPSTRLFLNPLYIATTQDGRRNDAPLIDWPSAHRRKMEALRQDFEQFIWTDEALGLFRQFVAAGGERLLSHARFEVLDARFINQGISGWRNWPGEWRDAESASVRSLGEADEGVRFQLFLQWRAECGLADAQARAKKAGMKIGLIADMAVGVDPDGSLAWSSPGEMLEGLSIGAPPDLFNTQGQDWGLTTFSPLGLRRTDDSGFIATLRAAMRNAGGMRLDHAMGLRRLWVIPRGASPAEGVYLEFPADVLMNLIVRESQAHKCIVIAEDLGTVPDGFRRSIAQSSLYGMRVLWFERDKQGNFIAPQRWDKQAAALSTTHDLPTIAGWWTGRDIAWRSKIVSSFDQGAARGERERDKEKLWRALTSAYAAAGTMPTDFEPVIDAALVFLGKTPCPLAIVPVEDLLGLSEQPNLPGTIDQHPNWRRRLETARPFSDEQVQSRAAILSRSRKS
jgi:4-alpha-glucanotransferase